ncbi:uncharacterized protein LOC129570763 [Sitodiplosis mosellana]|uniref:uncharacterized protein LOC129570763 n=1 Tax=Sitodiplosis mosellana TaxID=263140 RepID=UPI002444B4FF|nr:uncharacterized protein LOC129570763 [Sitodiplosis mosellana]XP_055306453.1 uncharacterized protein LOC129570763 [Sitodiplosis mosellana]
MSNIMKIFRSKRKASKKKRLSDESNDDDQNQTAAAGPSNRPASPPIFKLTVDCCDEIFDYWSTKDLHSFGQTCKAMQKVAGEYFKRNCAGAEKFTRDDGIYTYYYDHEGASNKQTLTSGFNRYITNISHYYDHGRGPLRYIESHSDELDSVNNLYLVCTRLNKEKAEYFRKILPKIENLAIHQCSAWCDMFNDILKLCENVTNLWIQDDLGDIISRKKNPWLLQNYPKLKRLHLGPRNVNEINELVSFFERNPNVDIFSTNYRCFWANRNQLMDSKAKLETLCVEDFHYDPIGNMHEICDLLKQLHEKGFYKRLHLNFREISQQLCDQIILVPGLERLHFKKFNKIYSVPQMVSLKELHLPSGLKANDIQIL